MFSSHSFWNCLSSKIFLATLCGCMLTENNLICFNYFYSYKNYGNFIGFYVFIVEILFAILLISYAHPLDKQLISANGIRHFWFG